MVGDAILVAASVSAVCGIAMLRFAWSLPQRSAGWNAGGWGLLVVSTVLAWMAQGAWGAAIAGLWGMGAAMVLVAIAASTAPAMDASSGATRKPRPLPGSKYPRHILRRMTTFLIVGLAAMIVSTGLALAMRSAVLWAGASEANGNVAGLFTMPIAWTLLGFALLMTDRRIRQWQLLLLCAVPGLITVVAGTNP